MPYERFGYALLPDYRGIDKPEFLSPPAAGTLWQDQQAERGVEDSFDDVVTYVDGLADDGHLRAIHPAEGGVVHRRGRRGRGAVAVGGDDHVDGAVWSATNADLAAGCGFDTVVVIAPLSGPFGPGELPRRLRDGRRDTGNARQGAESQRGGEKPVLRRPATAAGAEKSREARRHHDGEGRK